MINAPFKISRRSFLLIGLFSIYMAKSSNYMLQTKTVSDKEILPEATNATLYKWILGKNDLR
tara:strand:- start:174 stop:359 length:186 start_codon:yes stop_codon:yes gene_type:complete